MPVQVWYTASSSAANMMTVLVAALGYTELLCTIISDPSQVWYPASTAAANTGHEVWSSAWKYSMDKQHSIDMPNGREAWMQHGGAVLACRMGMQNGHSLWTSIMTCSMDMDMLKIHHGHAKKWACSTAMDMQLGHGNEASTGSSIEMVMLHRQRHAASTWTSSFDMDMQYWHGHIASTWICSIDMDM